MSFGEKLKELRKEKKISQSELASKLGRSQASYCDWEKNNTEPDIKTIIQLANIFECSIDYLVDREDEDGTIVISGNHLSNDETVLLDKLRQLQPVKKEIIYHYVDFLLDEQKNGK